MLKLVDLVIDYGTSSSSVHKLRANMIVKSASSGAECVETPDELLRTSLRLFVLNVHRGLASAPPRVRQSQEAHAVSQTLYAVSEFLSQSFDADRLDAELERLCSTLAPLATTHGFDPFRLNLYATGDLRRRRGKAGAAVPSPLRA